MMNGKWIVPNRFEDIDILYMFETLTELASLIQGFDESEVELDDLLKVASSVQERLYVIEDKVGLDRIYFDS